MELNIADVCMAIARRYPKRVAIVSAGRSFSWAETDDRTDRLASVLARVAPGRRAPFGTEHGWQSTQEHVALYLLNGHEYLEGMLGAYKAAWAPVNINYRYRADELRYVLSDSRARVVVAHSRFAATLAEVLGDLDSIDLVLQVRDNSESPLIDGAIWYEDALAAAAPFDEVERSGDDLYVCYTGGTTGMPKGVLWRQADFVVSALGVRRSDGSDIESVDELVEAASVPKLRALPAPPLMHGAAHWNALSCWLAGGTVIIQSVVDRFDAADIIDTIDAQGATSLLIVGDSFAKPLLDELATRPTTLPSLRHLLSGGAVLSPPVKSALMEALPNVTIVDVLGSSESGRQGVATDRPSSERDGAAATRFAMESTATVVSDDRTVVLTPLPDGENEIGWLTQTGRVPLGYLGDQIKTEATFPVIDGVRHVVAGDRARYRGDGSLELLGRESVCINTGGEKVFAEEVEVALTSHAAVRDAIVCGRPHERWGNEIVGVVSLGEPVDDDELIAHVKLRLASFKAPKAIVVVDTVQRSPSGKPDYAWAREVASR